MFEKIFSVPEMSGVKTSDNTFMVWVSPMCTRKAAAIQTIIGVEKKIE